jgi:hypothetical protein
MMFVVLFELQQVLKLLPAAALHCTRVSYICLLFDHGSSCAAGAEEAACCCTALV